MERIMAFKVQVGPAQITADDQANEVLEASSILGLKAYIFKASSERDIDDAFGKCRKCASVRYSLLRIVFSTVGAIVW
jgi:hypothetical protein